MKWSTYPSEDDPVYEIDIIDTLTQDVYELNEMDELEVAISKLLEKKWEEFALNRELQEAVAILEEPPNSEQVNTLQDTLPTLKNRPLPSVLQPPTIELKPLPNHLKYVFLE